MPELPEVETIARGLRAGLVGRRIVGVELSAVARVEPAAEPFAEQIQGALFEQVGRYGKHLLIGLSGERTLVGHLRMTGQLRVQAPEDQRLAHTHAVLGLDDGRELRWRDVRRFGWLRLVPAARVPDLLAGLGPDALEVNEAMFVERIRSRKRQMKALLLAQDVVCGLGNIYADESLWRARIHPLQDSSRLSVPRAARLFGCVQELLTEAIAARGTSIDGDYVATDGFPGGFQEWLQVYGRAGRPAACCGGRVRRILVSQRSTCFCPRCQRKR